MAKQLDATTAMRVRLVFAALLSSLVMSMQFAHASERNAWLPDTLFRTTPQLAACQQPQVWLWYPHTLNQYQRDQLQQRLQKWQQHPVSELVGCFALQSYRPQDLNCRVQGKRLRKHCQLPLLTSQLDGHHILLHNTTTAFSRAKHISLPTDTSVALLAHEVAHWLGFVDEYPMSAEIAQRFCRAAPNFDAVNLIWTETDVVTDGQLRELYRKLPWRGEVADYRQLGTLEESGMWRLGSVTTVQTGLYPTTTCAHANGFTWRPVSGFTAMQYHDTNVWPELYLRLARPLR